MAFFLYVGLKAADMFLSNWAERSPHLSVSARFQNTGLCVRTPWKVVADEETSYHA
jgi:hypothetical protein